MKSKRTNSWKSIVATLGAACTVLSAEISELDLGAFNRPADGQGENLADVRKGSVPAAIAKMASFEKWKTFEDDRIKFSYPDHGAITLEVQTNGPVPVDGARVSDVDTSYSRAYRLVVAGKTLTVLMLNNADWLDDGICLCGAVVYDRYLIRNGNLYRFSFLSNGILKKMQVLNEGERLMMFEWTHSPIHPEVYRRIARSVELKRKGPWEVNECRKIVMERYGPRDVVGWLDEGSSADAAETLLGTPARTAGDGTRVWEYSKKQGGYQWTEMLSLRFTNGRLDRFDSSYYGRSRRETIMGSIPWMQKQAEPYETPRVRGGKAKQMPEDLKKVLLDLFLKKAEDADNDFEQLCQVLLILVDQGVQDKRHSISSGNDLPRTGDNTRVSSSVMRVTKRISIFSSKGFVNSTETRITDTMVNTVAIRISSTGYFPSPQMTDVTSICCGKV